MTEPTTIFNAAEFLETQEDVLDFLEEALATNDPAFIAKSLGIVARAHGMTEVARTTGMSRESLYKALGENGNPQFGTIVRILGALGFRLAIAEVASSPR